MSEATNTSKNWTPEQLEILETSGLGLAVTAGAGAGKTTTIVEKCVRLLQGKPSARICAVSFTERSASDLRAKLSRALRDSEGFDLSKHWITTIHGLCGSILREFPREAGYQGDERVLSDVETQRIWQRAIQTLWMESENLQTSEQPQSALQRLLSREGKAGAESLLLRFRELEARAVIEQAMSEQDLDLRAAAEVAARAIHRFNAFKAKASGIDFSDLEKAALSALSYENVRSLLRARFDLVLVDEFQDTNPTQAQIIWSVIRSDQSNLCVVGDPKQSIYRFRDADVGLFEESCQRLPIRRSLTVNFRSHPRILEVVNQICAPLFEASSLSYEPLNSGRAEKDFGLSDREDPVFRLEVRSPDDLATWIASEHSRGVRLESMAILVRRVRGMENWIQALSRRGIPVAVGGGGLFWKDPRVLELLSLLKWWWFPADEWAALGFLTAPWVQVPNEQLDLWKSRDASFEAFWDSDHPIARHLGSWRSKSLRPGELLASLLETPGLENSIGELSQSLLSLWYRCEQLSFQGSDFGDVVRRLHEANENGKREKEVPPPSNRGVLPILTVHASKGLEFDQVFLLDFGRKQKNPPGPLLFVDRKRGVFLIPRGPDGKRNDRDEKYKDWKNFEASAAVSESKRAFYVALTRAKKKLIFVCSPIDPEKGFVRDPESALRVDHWRGWLEHLGQGIPSKSVDFVSEQETKLSQADHSVPDVARRNQLAESVPARIRARHSVSEWTLLGRCERSYAQNLMVQFSVSQPESEALIPAISRPEYQDENLQNRRNDGISADELGRRVHALLERWAEHGKGVVSAEVLEEFHQLMKEAGKGRLHESSFFQWLEGRGRLHEHAYVELPFEWVVGGASLVGVMDRVEEIFPGHWRVLDYKVLNRRKSDDEIRALYSHQLEI
ncbi:MAG: UvrD-helicase domain-containing protein, partial [Bdellovibrionales bacterium]|nr:UvrD-helicase domain-containing protein [Bdellovibrionales bacterium]